MSILYVEAHNKWGDPIYVRPTSSEEIRNPDFRTFLAAEYHDLYGDACERITRIVVTDGASEIAVLYDEKRVKTWPS